MLFNTKMIGEKIMSKQKLGWSGILLGIITVVLLGLATNQYQAASNKNSAQKYPRTEKIVQHLKITLPRGVKGQRYRANPALISAQTTFSNYQPTRRDLKQRIRQRLTRSQELEINSFVAQLINRMRAYIGTPKLKVSASSLTIARTIAQKYQLSDWRFAENDDVNVTAINDSVAPFGFFTLPEQNIYENLVYYQGSNQPYAKNSLAFIKAQLWHALQILLTAPGEETNGHIASLLAIGPDKAANKTEYLGVAIDSFGVMHFEILPQGYLVNSGTKHFNTRNLIQDKVKLTPSH